MAPDPTDIASRRQMDGLIIVREQCPGTHENITGRFPNVDIHVREVAGGCSVCTRDLVIQSDVALQDYNQGFVPTICQLIGAVAHHDGVFTAEEYQAVIVVNRRIVSIVDSPILINTLTLRSLLEPPAFASTLKKLRKVAKDQTPELKQYAFQSLQPLLSIQRADQGKISQSILMALELEESPLLREFAQSLWSKVKGASRRRTSYERIMDFALTFDAKELLKVLQEDGFDLYGERLNLALSTAKKSAIASCRKLESNNHDLEVRETTIRQLLSITETMIEQTRKRLHTIRIRADRQKAYFEEDMNVMLEDAEMQLEKVWKDRLIRSARDKHKALHEFRDDEAARIIRERIDKIRIRYQNLMTDWTTEYESFCDELSNSKEIFSFNMNRREFLELIPSASIKSRLMSSLDSASSSILLSGGVAAVAVTGVMGVGTAVGLLLTPIGLGVTAGVALSGLYKWLSRPDERMVQEAEDKAERTAQNMRKLCETAIAEHADAIDDLVDQFYDAAESIYSPVMMEVKISTMYGDYQRKVIAEISNNTERYVENMLKN